MNTVYIYLIMYLIILNILCKYSSSKKVESYSSYLAQP